MPEKHVFEYAVIRVVPRVDRGECLNVGLVLYCKSLKYLGFLYEINEPRLKAFAPGLDIVEIRDHLESFSRICAGGKTAGTIGMQDMPSRFRWLTAKRSTVIQPSEIHPGYTENPEETLRHIFQKMVQA